MFDLRRQLHDASLGLPPGMNVHKPHSFFRCHPTGSLTPFRCARLREGICQVATKRANTRWARWAERSTCLPHLVVLITTRSRSVFSRMNNTKTSRRYHKRELSSHTSVTSSCYLKTHASEGRSTQKGKVAGSRSVPLPRGVNQAGFLLEREDREKRPTSYPLGFAPHWLNSPVFFSSSSQRGSACTLVSGIRVW